MNTTQTIGKMYRVLQTEVPPRSTQSQWTFPPTFTGNWQTLPVLMECVSGTRRCSWNIPETSSWNISSICFTLTSIAEVPSPWQGLVGYQHRDWIEHLNKAPGKKAPVFWWTYRLRKFARLLRKSPLGHHPPVKPLFACNSVVFLSWQGSEADSYSTKLLN